MAPRLVLVSTAQIEQTPRGARLLERLRAYPLLEVSERVLAAAADTITPQGVVAVVPLPKAETKADPGPLVLIVDGVRDPGNLGTVLRAGEASGIVRMVVAVSSVDPFSPKVVRAAMGAHFHLAVLSDPGWSEVRRLVQGRPIWLAEMSGGVPYDEVDWRTDSALIVGGEAAGAGAARALATGAVSIPMGGRAESLNAAMAASILIFEAARQRRRKSE